MSEPAAPEATTVAPTPAPAETAATPSVAGGAELGTASPGRAAAIAKAREAMQARDNEALDQASKQAEEHAAKTRSKAERDKVPERGDDGKFRPALSPADATKQAKEAEAAKPAAVVATDEKSELEKLEEQWRKARSAKKQARDERKAAGEWRSEQARRDADNAADAALKAKNPAAWLEKHGFDFREEAKRAVATVEKTPAEKRADEAVAKAEALEEKLKAIEERDAATTQQAALAKLNAEHAAAWSDSTSDYPTLAAHYSADEIIDSITELRVDFFRKTADPRTGEGREIPISVALEHLEKNAKIAQARFSRKTEPSGAAKPERTERATVAAKAAKPRAVVGPVTNSDAAVVATSPVGLSPDERRARSTRLAAEGWRR